MENSKIVIKVSDVVHGKKIEVIVNSILDIR